MNTWLLLERTEQLLPNLYRILATPHLTQLFDSTELVEAAPISPILVQNDPDSALLQAVQQAPEEWPGLIIHSTCSMEELLGHLRFILIIRFEQQSRGVLRYSHPTTASYFFPACSADELRLWLGPISQLAWYGATWHNHAVGESAWQQLENAAASNWQLPPAGYEPALSNAQEIALQQHRDEHLLYCWWLKHPQAPWPHAQQWLREGVEKRLTEAEFELFLAEQLHSLSKAQQS